MNLELLKTVQTHFAAIHAASSAFIPLLSLSGIENDIMLAASSAGLAMLRNSGVDLTTLQPGEVVLGAIPDLVGQSIMTFMLQFAGQNGLDPKSIQISALSAEQKNYAIDTGSFTTSLEHVCTINQLDAAMQPFVAVTAAVKIVLAGREMKMVDPTIGMALTAFHIAAGSKTVPYPMTEKSDG